jgi:O-antigen/teichoic acid export membrane protein
MNGRLKRLFTAASIVTINQSLLMLATIGVTFKVIAHLGAHRFGVYSTVLAYASFFCILTFSSGIDELAIKDNGPS